jgi:hypothetical protein
MSHHDWNMSHEKILYWVTERLFASRVAGEVAEARDFDWRLTREVLREPFLRWNPGVERGRLDCPPELEQERVRWGMWFSSSFLHRDSQELGVEIMTSWDTFEKWQHRTDSSQSTNKSI